MARPSRADAQLQELQPKFSSSRITSEPESHEVFLSHSGKQKPFVSELYDEFVNWPRFPSINPFFDRSHQSLPKGEEFPSRILEAARKCVVAVVILTKEYVTSKWPMLELLAFVEAQKSTNPGLKLLPVFYDDLPTSSIDDHIVVDDSWVAEWKKMAPRAHKNITMTAESCKEALCKLRKINGIVLTNDMSLKLLRSEIVKAALKFLPSSSELDTENIQGCLRLCESISEMFQKNRNEVYCLGLYGMGGLGKTTMCKALCSYFGPLSGHRVCHLEFGSTDTDMKEMKFKRHIKILRELSGVPEDEIDKLEKSHAHLRAEKCVKQCLSKEQRKFLAVDNVQDGLASYEEAEDYLKWLSPGSIIIITSRSRDNLVSVTRNSYYWRSMYCKPIPTLEENEAATLFLRIAAPEVNWLSLDRTDREILRKWMQICFFPPTNETGGEQVRVTGGDRNVNGETGHYHPLALRAVASYLQDLYTEQDPFKCWRDALKKKSMNVFFHARASIDIIEVLGIGFNDRSMCDLSKQLFIDVALYAIQSPGSAEGTFKWLVSVHECNPQIIQLKLRQLRRKCFLDYDDGTSSQESCKNISMHELYREFAKSYLGIKNVGLFRFGVYDGGDVHPPSLENPEWATVPRILLQRLTDVAKVKEWRAVSVLHLVCCKTITSFSIGELVSLRQLWIADCPKLEVLSWTQDIVTKGPGYENSGVWGKKLWSVDLYCNESLRTLPDFSSCSELERLVVGECSSSVGPLRLHNCPKLRRLYLASDEAPELQSLQSCPSLRSVRLQWKATHTGLPLLDQLPRLVEVVIVGSSVVPLDGMNAFSPLGGKNQFFKQHPKDGICHDLIGVGMLTNLERILLICIPLGKLPVELATVGSSLQSLHLSGCLLSQSVDFSAFPNLYELNIRWTNVEEVCGLERLTKLRHLDCSYCFQLQKVPGDLRPLSELQAVDFTQCPKLQGIPRLPPGCSSGDISEVTSRVILAALAFTKTAAKPLPLRRFAIAAGERKSRGTPSQSMGKGAIHVTVGCDGCMMFPIVGPRYEAKPVRTWYSLCTNCFSDKCRRNKCSDTENTKPRWEAEGEWKVNYDLCSSCFEISGCDLRLFYRIDQTHLPEQFSKLTFRRTQESLRNMSMSKSGVPKGFSKDTDLQIQASLELTVRSSPF